MEWPFKHVLEATTIVLNGEQFKVSRWRQDADRSKAFSEAPEFLLATDQEVIFASLAGLFCGPYPRATVALCSNFAQVVSLAEGLRVPLLIVSPQNLLLYDGGESLITLMLRVPQLRAQVHTGAQGVIEMLAGTPVSDRIDVLYWPVQPREFHGTIAQGFGFDLPEWFVKAVP